MSKRCGRSCARGGWAPSMRPMIATLDRRSLPAGPHAQNGAPLEWTRAGPRPSAAGSCHRSSPDPAVLGRQRDSNIRVLCWTQPRQLQPTRNDEGMPRRRGIRGGTDRCTEWRVGTSSPERAGGARVRTWPDPRVSPTSTRADWEFWAALLTVYVVWGSTYLAIASWSSHAAVARRGCPLPDCRRWSWSSRCWHAAPDPASA